MLSSFRRKITDIKSEINNKIDHLEVDKNQILNRTQRKIDSKLTLNGINYFLRNEEKLLEIHQAYREIEHDSQKTEQSVKNCLIQTTNMFHSMKTIEKEFSSICKLLESFNVILDNIERLSIQINHDLVQLDRIYEEKKQLSLKQNEIENSLNDDELDLKDNSIKLAISIDS